jgi:sigma-B regulation protein RsbU (phosphoserine phosphatase)
MAAGDLALFFTDGATEARSAAGELFGVERLAAALERVAGRPLEAAIAELLAEIAAFRAGEPDDDVTLLLLRMLGDARPARAGATRSEVDDEVEVA